MSEDFATESTLPAGGGRPRWRLPLLSGLLLLVAGLALAQTVPRYYENALSPFVRPDRPLGTREARAALQTPADMVNALMGRAPDDYRARLVAFTFDDGPYPMYTPLLLDTLERYQVRATFFLVGSKIREFPELARQVAAGGHELANHTDSHRRGAELGPDGLVQDILRCEASLVEKTGVRPHLFRPAGGFLAPPLLKRVQELGYTTVGDTVNPGDWWVSDPRKLLEGAFRGRNREGIVLLHTGSVDTVQMLPQLIGQLRAKGFRFVTVSQLAAATGTRLPLNPRLTQEERPRTLEASGLDY